LDLLRGLETYNISGHTSYFKGRCKISKFGRYPGELAVYIKDDISKGVKEIVSDMKEILRLNIRVEYSLHGIFLDADMNCRIGMLQVDLPHSWDALENVSKEFNTYRSRVSKDSICNVEERQLIEFCERNTSDILNLRSLVRQGKVL
jgi:hypothetical protein